MINERTGRKEYASNLNGTALLAWNRWLEESGKLKTLPAEEWAQVHGAYMGRVAAFAEIVIHITGRHPSQFEHESELEQFLGVGTVFEDKKCFCGFALGHPGAHQGLF